MDLKIYYCGLNVASILGFSKQRGEMEWSPEYVLFHGTGAVGIIFGPARAIWNVPCKQNKLGRGSSS
jgi:hypothetical protein